MSFMADIKKASKNDQKYATWGLYIVYNTHARTRKPNSQPRPPAMAAVLRLLFSFCVCCTESVS